MFELLENPSSPRVPAGFAFGGGHAGIKRSRMDLGLIRCTSPQGATVAGAFTQNRVRAACVDRGEALLPAGGIRAVIINSGNANAMTGAAGAIDDEAMAAAVAERIGASTSTVLTNSTGVIGVPLPVAKIAAAVPELLANIDGPAGSPSDFLRAILTTDTCTKSAMTTVETPAGPVQIFGAAKGSGMIHPNMATTLGYVVTDLAIEAEALQSILSEEIVSSFNAISVDGDTSTNDTVLVLASGESGVEASAAGESFVLALRAVLQSLAKQVARDGEGATRLMQVEVRGAPTDAAAHQIARKIASSSLFKCSIFAGEAGWGRLACAAGQAACEAGFDLDPQRFEITAQGQPLFLRGELLTPPAAFGRRLLTDTIVWELDLGAGDASFCAWGCDLSYDYVRINADETLQIEVGPDGRVGRNISLESYTPKLKHQLLVDGLSYVRRFSGMRVLVQAEGAVLARPALMTNFARDLELMLDAGIRPLVVLTDDRAEASAQAIEALFSNGLYQIARVEDLPGKNQARIQPRLDRGQACLLALPAVRAEQIVNLAARLGVGKLLCVGDDQGLHDGLGLRERLGPQEALIGLESGELTTCAASYIELVRLGVREGLPAIHLLDGRMPHALVAELFTDQGVGTLVSRQDPLER
jgi:acetylglutamate kinase